MNNHRTRPLRLFGQSFVTALGLASLAGPCAADVMSELDSNSYAQNMTVEKHLFDGMNRRTKFQFMTQGNRRYLFQGDANGHSIVIDVSDAMYPRVISEYQFEGFQIQLAYNEFVDKWILITSAAPAMTDITRGENKDLPGLRGIKIYDATDPTAITHISDWSTDKGNPARTLQTGSGTHRNFYDGGRYAYLDTAPDNSYVNYEYARANGLQIIDLSDPSNPQWVADWWIEGMREGEEEAYREWPHAGDVDSVASMHGAFVPPMRIEEGGKYSYSAWGSYGVIIHDLSDIESPQIAGRWSPGYKKGGIQFHAVDSTRVDRGFVIASPEPIKPECMESWHDVYILDVTDPENIEPLATLPVPEPPDTAPYRTFCEKRGRFGTHNAPHVKAPGKVDPNFTCYTYFNAGLQCFDITNPREPIISAYFIPRQGGDLRRPPSYYRDTDNVFIEWDRSLIWLATTTGIYLLSSPDLGEPIFERRPVESWSLPSLN